MKFSLSPVDQFSFRTYEVERVSDFEFVDVLSHLAPFRKSFARKVDLIDGNLVEFEI